MQKKIKPETEIRNLKEEIEKLQELLSLVGVPLLVAHLNNVIITKDKGTIKKICLLTDQAIALAMSLPIDEDDTIYELRLQDCITKLKRANTGFKGLVNR